MSYEIKSEYLKSYLSRRSSSKLPPYCEKVAFHLSEEVRGCDFKEAEPDGSIHVSMFEHSMAEVCELVDWSVDIWNQTMRSVHRSRKLTTEEFIANRPLRDGDTPLESLLNLFEVWNEGEEHGDGPYISLAKYPSSNFTDDPLATVGNLCAAIGLAVLDKLIMSPPSNSKETSLFDLGIAWEFALLARWNNHMDMAMHFSAESSRERMARAARARHSKDPKQQIKRQVNELWQKWESAPASYPSAAAFARDMCDKWPDVLTSEVVVSRWVRDWRKANCN